jgi:hypothetical protein
MYQCIGCETFVAAHQGCECGKTQITNLGAPVGENYRWVEEEGGADASSSFFLCRRMRSMGKILTNGETMSARETEAMLRRMAEALPKSQRPMQRTQRLDVEVPAGMQLKQTLRLMRPFFKLAESIPSLLPNEAQITLRALFDCFEKSGEVKEGIIEDILWGFEQCGIPRKLTAKGLVSLESAGYICFQAPNNTPITFEAAKIHECWIRYQPKLLDMLYEG